jgi:predicted esterase
MRTLIHLEAQRFSDQNTERIFIGGFSQGSGLALSIFLRSTVQLGGVFGLSGMVPLTTGNMLTTAAAIEMQSNTPVFLDNGLRDDKYLYVVVTESYKYLKDTIYKVTSANPNPNYDA